MVNEYTTYNMRSIRYEIGVLTLSLIISLTFYFPTFEYGMVSDFLGWIIKYRAGNLSDFIHSFGYNGLHPFFHLINYTFYKLFGLNAFYWYVFFGVLHGVNGYLVFKIAYRIANHIKQPPLLTAATAGLLFLLIPYQVEPVTWKACLHYLMSVCLFSVGFLNLFRWIDTRKRMYYFFHHLSFILALLTLEIALASPFIYASYFLIMILLKSVNLKARDYLFKVGLPHLVLLIVYFLSNYWLLGDLVGHYGAEKHLAFDVEQVLGSSWSYFIKYAGLMHFFPDSIQGWFYGASAKWWMIGACILAIPISIVVWKGKKTHLKIAWVAIAAFFMGLVPIITLWFNDLTLYENDRYGYFSSIHFCLFVAFLLSRLSFKWKLSLSGLFLVINLIFLGKMLTYAYEAGTIAKALLDDYEWEDRDVLFMAIPQNYNGLYMYGNYDAEATTFKRSLELLKKKKIAGTMKDVASFNMKRITDRVDINQEGPNLYKAGIAQGGTWFWRAGLGLTDFENDLMKVNLEGWYYMVEVKDTATDYLYLSVKDGTWTTLE